VEHKPLAVAQADMRIGQGNAVGCKGCELNEEFPAQRNHCHEPQKSDDFRNCRKNLHKQVSRRQDNRQPQYRCPDIAPPCRPRNAHLILQGLCPRKEEGERGEGFAARENGQANRNRTALTAVAGTVERKGKNTAELHQQILPDVKEVDFVRLQPEITFCENTAADKKQPLVGLHEEFSIAQEIVKEREQPHREDENADAGSCRRDAGQTGGDVGSFVKPLYKGKFCNQVTRDPAALKPECRKVQCTGKTAGKDKRKADDARALRRWRIDFLLNPRA